MARSKRFQLETLHCPEFFDLPSIVHAHTSLQTLLIFSSVSASPLPSLDSTSLLLIRQCPIGGFGGKSFTLFPDLISLNNTQNLSERLGDSFDWDDAKPHSLRDISLIHFYLNSFQDPVKLRVFLEAINRVFGNLPSLRPGISFFARSSEGLVSAIGAFDVTGSDYPRQFTPATVQSIHAFRSAKFLKFFHLDNGTRREEYEFTVDSSLFQTYVKTWSEGLPDLATIYHDSGVLRLDGHDGWVVSVRLF
jgi:hypothetical protein